MNQSAISHTLQKFQLSRLDSTRVNSIRTHVCTSQYALLQVYQQLYRQAFVIIQYDTIQYDTILYCTVWILHCTALHFLSTVLTAVIWQPRFPTSHIQRPAVFV